MCTEAYSSVLLCILDAFKHFKRADSVGKFIGLITRDRQTDNQH